MKKKLLSLLLSAMLCVSGWVPAYAEEAVTDEVGFVEESVDSEPECDEVFGDIPVMEADDIFQGSVSEPDFSELEAAVEFSSPEETADFSDGSDSSDSTMLQAGNEVRIELDVQNGTDIAYTLDKALAQAKNTSNVHYTVIIPPGSYTISSMLHIFSNTTIKADGAVITKQGGVSKILKAGTDTYIKQKSTTGYDLFKNIEIDGGVWDNQKTGGSAMKFGHASNITLRNMTVKGNAAGAHLLEVGGVDGLTVENCTFSGYQPSNKYVAQEAIEIECVREGVFSEYGPFNDLPCKNIRITGCVFEDLVSGVGMHNAVYGNYTENVDISGNTFRNIGFQCVKMAHTKNLTIKNNKFQNVTSAVEIEALNNEKAPAVPGQPYTADMNVRISGNEITLAVVIPASNYACMGISLKGTELTANSNGVPKGMYKLSGVVIENNTISGYGRGITLENADNCKLLNNTVSFKKSGTKGATKGFGMLIWKDSRNNLVKDCVIEDTKDDNDGIRIINTSHNNTIEGCTVTGGKKYGIAVRNCNGTRLLKNHVSGRERGGICIDSAKSCQLVSNTVSSNKKYGILLLKSNISKLEKNVMAGNADAALWVSDSKTPSNVKSLTGITVKQVKSSTAAISGTAKGTSKVYVKAGSKTMGSASVAANGSFSVKIKKQKKNTKLTVYAVDKRNNRVSLTTKVK